MTTQRILITGASGGVAGLLRPRIIAPGRSLRLLDIADPPELSELDSITDSTPDEEIVIGSVTDLGLMEQACRGMDALIHLGGLSVEAAADDIVDVNIKGTITALEAARRAGVPRVILASSNHAVGFQPRTDRPIPADAPHRPDTYYGLSKVAMEGAGRMYHDRFGIDVICLRIGSWFAGVSDLRGLATWMSPADGARLIEACLRVESPGYRVVWGISRNTRRWFSLDEGEAVGYHPVDDSEIFAPALIAEHGEPDFDADAALNRVGGPWTYVELGKRM
ncbi:MAG TPA: NAD(P)-dependent oxidoreductase [Stackebrandtia sp.]|uniref:NAD-dependent epimerase/dehydratase family protein n=1 Tax=Stackebrandtia sp. TaxID=2023065 RepID=UPI002D33BD4C|nr:NAD(P)-dependent oxidoreductase [Stackebrandtia sp.]HZE40845.1 NAD(P)-dependent oxidoreductase [Stackebrandtia sp.]